jgi:hypothetical protein
MGWVKEALQQLEDCGQAQVRPVGGSMRGRIESGQLVTLKKVDPADVQVDDVVLVRWKGNYILHVVKEVKGSQILIGNNLGKVNRWADRDDVIARVAGVSD